MAATITDKELNTELQELYLTGKQWLSDVEFLNSEQHFLEQLIANPNWNTYYQPHTNTTTIANTLAQAGERHRQLYLNIVHFMNELEPLITGTSNTIGIRLIEDFSTLQYEVNEALFSLKAIKYYVVDSKIN
ncbi:hypothetical protein HH214_20440 [Mucilaginibacter robiniae]|uniref:Uncharacterized protein n=1 Tax=Mucilaginibacter robiniae TaxID=2728022 RepID=A0A7L5E4T5_9SPHI|nr:hypothetical protein [Mucilaginibacter robiniae]QJD98075.1 hypothetical protein HH214_20440 [Mucilaginibacter robiniae]